MNRIHLPSDVDVSVVMPAYRAASLAVRSVSILATSLEQIGAAWEIIVVDDTPFGIPPATWDTATNVRLIQHDRNRGKGAAVRTGMLAARGRVRIYTDVDLPYGTESFGKLMTLIEHRGFHIVIGDRTLGDSEYHQFLPLSRRLASFAFSEFVGRAVTGGFFDTQCGLKALRGDVAELLCSVARVDRFAFDVEMVYLALKFRLDVKRIPVRLQRNDTSSVRVVRDGLAAARDVLRIKWGQVTGRYACGELDRLVSDDYRNIPEARKMFG